MDLYLGRARHGSAHPAFWDRRLGLRLKFFTLVCFLGFSLLCRSGYADTLNLVSVGGQSAGGYYIYPYNFSVNGSQTLTEMMCLDFNREVTIGESWQATSISLPTDNSLTSQDYRADAWIFGQLGKVDPSTGVNYTAAEIQYADWDIFDPVDIGKNAAFDSTSSYLEQQAMLAANNATLMNSGYFSQFQIYLPTSDATGWTAGTPQRFIAESTAVTPEPASFLLLGTGLLSLFVLARRRGSRSLITLPDLQDEGDARKAKVTACAVPLALG